MLRPVFVLSCPVSVADFVATISKTLDVGDTLEIDVAGRPIGLVDGPAKPIVELFS